MFCCSFKHEMKTSFHIGLLLIGLSAEIVSGQDYVLLANGESGRIPITD